MKRTAKQKGSSYIVSDLHLDHYNIIEYCNRPFLSVKEMNTSIVNNWNNTISPNDRVYFLGDLAFGKNSHSPFYWLQRLNGRKILIKGSHDNGLKAAPFKYVYIGGTRILLIHNPYDIPLGWRGWTIHGHVHDTKPFVDRTNKRINVSVEVTNYKPVSVNLIETIIRNKLRSNV